VQYDWLTTTALFLYNKKRVSKCFGDVVVRASDW